MIVVYVCTGKAGCQYIHVIKGNFIYVMSSK